MQLASRKTIARMNLQLGDATLTKESPETLFEVAAPVVRASKMSSPGLWGLVAMLAVFVGIVHVYPDLSLMKRLGAAYQGISLMGATDELTYLSRITRALNGDYLLGNAMIYEHRKDPWVYSPVPEVILAQGARLLRCSAVDIDVISTAIFPPAIFLLTMLLFSNMQITPVLSIAGALGITLGHYLLSRFGLGFFPYLSHLTQSPPLALVRPVSPQFHYMVLLVALIVLYQWWEKPNPIWTVSAAVVCGAQFYLNVFYWFWMGGGVVCLMLLSMIGAKNRRSVGSFLFLMVGACFIGIPYFLNTLACRAQPAYQDFLLRNGLILSHRPIVSWFQLILTLPVVILWLRRPASLRLRFVIAFLLGGWMCMNQQIVTGYTLQPFHWESQMNKMMVLIGLVVAVGEYAWPVGVSGCKGLKRKREWVTTVCLLVSTLLLAHAVRMQQRYLTANAPLYTERQALAKPIRWIASFTPADSVIVTSPADIDAAEYVTLLSGRYTYLSKSFFLAGFLTESEIEDRCLQTLAWFGFDSEQESQWLTSQLTLALGFQGIASYAESNAGIIGQVFKRMRFRYRQVLEKKQSLPRYRADYALLTDKEWLILKQHKTALGTVKPIYQDGHFVVIPLADPEMT